MGLVETFESGEMDGDLCVEIVLVFRLARLAGHFGSLQQIEGHRGEIYRNLSPRRTRKAIGSFIIGELYFTQNPQTRGRGEQPENSAIV